MRNMLSSSTEETGTLTTRENARTRIFAVRAVRAICVVRVLVVILALHARNTPTTNAPVSAVRGLDDRA